MEEITGEADYVNAPEGPADKKAPRPDDTKKGSAPEGTVDTKASPPDTSELSEDNAKQTAEIKTLTSRIQELETRENLTVSCDNLTQACTVSESNVKDLNAEIKTLTSQKDGLTTQIQEMETNWNELNVSRAQWSINEYCKEGEERLTWEEAREYCRALNADLAAAHNLTEKNIINYYSISTDGSWIGLRVKDGKWKWEDGSDLTNSSWVDPPTEGHCAISVLRIQTWLSVSCDQKQQWICQKKALSV
ncbi:C-type lectin domain family 10 member A-like isoform X2 [Gymnodraco acuticeps]|uniref:C-type lectin domain family 10 member A-like isoform X2 n=1 Tax=Gymnodraco acuticeps TaxID=8218 RepID=A0A6P8SUT4_GYMAC|nr:C-type lectin domain family 10 member A-like isoform X2 [Gymnodraco acuticeps]